MILKILSPEQLRQLYETELKRAFPPQELKPLQAMEALRARGRYDPLGLYDEDQLLGYALMWRCPGVPFALLDYLGTVEARRNGGLGSITLSLLREYYRDFRGIFGESEGAFSSDPEEKAMQQRRLGFYQRNGFRYGGYDCALFGVHYHTLLLGEEDVTAQELLQAHQTIYHENLSDEVYRRFIQIPLPEGEQPRPAQAWVEEGVFDDEHSGH